MAEGHNGQPLGLDVSLLQVRQQCGRGTSSSSWRATYDGQDILLKVANSQQKASSGAAARASVNGVQHTSADYQGLFNQMLLLDARKTMQLTHRHIVRCFGVVQLPDGLCPNTGPALAMALESCEAYTLKDVLTRSMASGRRAYKVKQACDWLLQVATALAHLHGSQPAVIHRDIRPGSVLLKREPNGDLTCRLAELGLHAEVGGGGGGGLLANLRRTSQGLVKPCAPAIQVAAAATTGGSGVGNPLFGSAESGPSEIQEPAILMENPSYDPSLGKNKKRSPRATAAAAVAEGTVPAGADAAALAVSGRAVDAADSPPPAAGLSGSSSQGLSTSPGDAGGGTTPRTPASPTTTTTTTTTTRTESASKVTAAALVTPKGLRQPSHGSLSKASGSVGGKASARGSTGGAAAALAVDSVGVYGSSAASQEWPDEPLWVPSPLAAAKGGAQNGNAMLSVLLSDQPDPTPDPAEALQSLDELLARLGMSDLKTLTRTELDWVHDLKGNSGGAYMYMAPEVFRQQQQPYNEKSDVFAFGVLSYELLAGELLLISIFNTGRAAKLGVRSPQGYAALVATGYRPPRLQKLPDSAWALIEACWHRDAVERPSMAAVVSELQRITAGELGDDSACGAGGRSPSMGNVGAASSSSSSSTSTQCAIC